MYPTTEDRLAGHNWIVWELEVRGPDELMPEDIAESTLPALRAIAHSFGCRMGDPGYEGTDEETAWRWQVRMPRTEHHNRTTRDIPRVVAALWEELRTHVPATLEQWDVGPNISSTQWYTTSNEFRAVYADLIDPIEVALLGVRRDGAEDLDPCCSLKANDGTHRQSVYALWLSHDPDSNDQYPPSWLVLHVGFVPEERFWPWQDGLPHAPALLLPRPSTLTWAARITTQAFGNPGHVGKSGAHYQWRAANPQILAERVVRDIGVLYPRHASAE